MPNRKEPRLEIDEEQPKTTLASEATTSEPQPTSKPRNDKHEKDSLETDKPKASEAFTSNEPPNSNQSSGSFKSWLAILLALLALGLLAWQYMQAQQQQASALVLAERIQKLEIRLSETGEDLSTAGSSFNEKLTESRAKITELRSENKKHWAIHNETRPAISALETKNKALDKNLSKIGQQLTATLAASESAVEKNTSLANKLKNNSDELNFHIKELNQRITEVSITVSALDQRLREQDQGEKLSVLEKEITQLSAKVSQALPEDLQAKLAEQEEILASLEASRKQLVSRVTRLMEEVRELQQAQ